MSEWKRYVTPAVIVGIILALFGFSSGLVCKQLDKKVDNDTLKAMIRAIEVQVEGANKNFERLYDEVRELKRE